MVCSCAVSAEAAQSKKEKQMRVGIAGTGAIAAKHAHAYKAIGYRITACANLGAEKGRRFARETGAEFVSTIEELCRRPDVDFVDLCTLPDFRLKAVELCAQYGKFIALPHWVFAQLSRRD